MSLKDNACKKFQANIFNKSKCQNCFKPRESHLLNDEDLNQAKPMYGGWLLLAPEGTNFDNPLHRSRKWQRRFFILYEHGLLRYALDEMPSTLPQGTINMNQCSDVIDGESRTGQKNSLCIVTPEKEHFIRAECKEIINGWQEALTVYPRTNKQNQKKKRKVDTHTQQVIFASCRFFFSRLFFFFTKHKTRNITCIYSLDSDTSKATLTWEGSNGSEEFPNNVSVRGGGRVGRAGRDYAVLSDVPRARRLSYKEAFRSDRKRQELRARTRSPGREEVARLFGEERRRSQVIGQFEDGQHAEQMDTSVSNDPSAKTAQIQRQGRSERRYLDTKQVCCSGQAKQGGPDLLNFKKGWMTKLYEDGMWKKHWFVLTDQSLKYFKDSIAEEALEMDGEIDLSTCYDVKEFPVQRNYGFQILCKEGACTLSAMTSGIRRNWIQAIMKNVRPTIAPDVSMSDGPRQEQVRSIAAPVSEPRKSRVRERRREGRSKTFDWSEFKVDQTEKPPKERADTEEGKMELDHPNVQSHKAKRSSETSNVQEEIEQRWHQVETTPLREAKQVPITSTSRNSERLPAHELAALLDKELGQKQKELDQLQEQNNLLKEQLEDALGREHSAREGYVLQAKLTSAMAEILVGEQAVVRMRNELKSEQQRSKEQEEEYCRGEATLRGQLKDSEDRLRDVEASLLERNQALRQLERQQALQRDHMREVQRLQERLQEVTARLVATEEGQILKEERLKKEQQSMQESHERERQSLCRRLADAERAHKDAEDRLLEAEQQVEALLRGRRASVNREFEEEMLKLQEDLAQKTDLVESLRESVRRLEEERGHLTCRCQELLNQITEADREVNKLRNRLETEEADYCNLEHSYEKATQEFQKISHILREKEEEIQQTKEMYERLMERKEEDLKEALVKMSALGSSLEETEQKLQVKEELLCQMSESLLHKAEPCNAEKDLQAKLVVAEDRIAELELHLRDLQLDYADLHMEREKSQHSLSNIEPTLEDSSKANEMESQAKRPRIRFSSIQCQKYINFEEIDASHSSTEENVSCVIALSQSSDPEKFISIIHALETKLLITEEKLRNLTKNLDVQESSQVEEISKTEPPEVDFSEITSVTHFTKALVCVENSREKVSSILSGSHCTNDSRLHLLSEIENDLFNASLHIRQGQKEEKHKEEQSKSENQYFTAESSDADELQIFTKTLTFEATVLKKMAQLIQTSKSDLLKALVEIWEDIDYAKRTDKDSLALVYASVLSRKLMLESRFWKELEKAETHLQAKESSLSADLDVNTSVVLNTCIKAELAYSIQNLKLCYEEKFQMLKRELSEVHSNLHQRDEALKAIIEASKRPDLSNVIKEVKNTFGFGEQKLADIHPPELAPYMEQIEMEEARDLAEEVVDRQLAGVLSSCAVESLQSFEKAYDSLVSELQRQAALLQRYAVEIQNTGSHPGLSKMIHCVLGRQTSHGLTSSSFCIREALIQAQVAYLACRLQAMHEEDLSLCKQTSQNMDALVQQHARNITAIQEKYEKRLQEECENLMDTVVALERENETLKSEIGKRDHFLKEERHESQLRKLEEQFEQRMSELQQAHKEKMEKLHSQYEETLQCAKKYQLDQKTPEVSLLPPCDEAATPMEEEEQGTAAGERDVSEVDSMVVLKDRIQELETQMNNMRDELENKHLEGDVASLREKYQRDFESLKATCERGFAAMEETHQKVVEDLQRQHQREISKLLEERERLLAEETAATIAAIEAMKNAHKEELEKNQRSQLSGLNSDIDELRLQYEEELQSYQRELEVLSEQYSQKCLENAHLAQALEAERQALTQCQRENQELNAHNQELNNRLTAEITRMRSCFSGETALSPLTQGKDLYELEVLLRIKESEIQYLKQEIHSLKDELQSALRDKKYATDKYKDIYTELSIVKAKADCDISKLKEKLLMATEGACGTSNLLLFVILDIMKSKSNPDFLKKERSTPKPIRGLRSKSLKEGLTVQERLKLFEAKDSRKI
uniref:Myosin phosphatase Rho interacting protein n=1 Tax=Oryzias sinensis TaxID=183150 RepID=A0A8C8DLB9_9TELE